MAIKMIEAITSKVSALPVEYQEQVLSIVDSLSKYASVTKSVKQPHKKLRDVLAYLNQHVTSQDIAEARREMWTKYSEENQQ